MIYPSLYTHNGRILELNCIQKGLLLCGSTGKWQMYGQRLMVIM